MSDKINYMDMKTGKMKRFNEFNTVNELQASDFEVNDKIIFTYNNRLHKGIIGDHFGSGVFVVLDGALKDYLCDGEPLDAFELFDGEENTPGFTIKNLKKRRV